MKKYPLKAHKNKLLIILLSLLLISFFLGLFYISFLDNQNKNLIKDSISYYLDQIKNNAIIYSKSLIKITGSNLFIVGLIWLLGISLIGFPIIILIFSFKSFLFSFTFTSILYNYKLKGLLLALIYVMPQLLNLLTLFFLTYYSLNFSIMLYKHLFKKENYHKSLLVKRYLKILFISLFLVLISSLLETYIVPHFIKFLYF